MKGHSSLQDVQAGGVLLEDKLGNDAADNLAVAGAHANERREATEEARALMVQTMAVQRMMIDIVAQRGRQKSTEEAVSSLSDSHISISSSSETGSSSESSSDASSRGSSSPQRHRGRSAPAAPD